MHQRPFITVGLILALGACTELSADRDQTQDRLADCEQGANCDPDQIRDRDESGNDGGGGKS